MRVRVDMRCYRVLLVVALAAGLVASSAGDGRAASCPPLDHSHGAWTALLARWESAGVVDYEGIARDGRDALDAYLRMLSGACTARYQSWSPARRRAFWVNAYNAFTVQLVLDNRPIESLQDVGWLPNAAFRRRFIPMPGLDRDVMSLDDIEHGILRADPALRDPRIHFALVCAARSCPPLRSEAYRDVDLDAQLDDQGRTFLRDTRKNRWEPRTHTLRLSSIFKWFRDDFETQAPSLAAYVAPYFDDETAAAIRATDVRIRFLRYDWSLNGR